MPCPYIPCLDNGTVRQTGCRFPAYRFIRSFKSAVTRHVNILRDTPGNRLWQPNYWEHIIRDEPELHRIREYIRNNPARWQEDALHPDQPPFPGETRESFPPYGDEIWMV